MKRHICSVTVGVWFPVSVALAAPPESIEPSARRLPAPEPAAEFLEQFRADILREGEFVARGGPAIESTGFEDADGWVAGAELCGGPANSFCTTPTPFANQCPAVGTNCCLDEPHPANGWYRSATDQHCGEPHIETANPASGTQHLRFAPGVGGNPTGCTGFGPNCRVTAFTPALSPDPTLVRFSIDFDIATPGWVAGAGELTYWGIDDSDLTARRLEIAFGSDGQLYVLDAYGYRVAAVPFDTSGAYTHVHVDVDPCLGLVEYWYDDALVYSQTSAAWIDHMNRAIFMSDNRAATFDVDNYVVTREMSVCGVCGDGIKGIDEECDGADGPCGAVRCIDAGQANECTCSPICTQASPCVLQPGDNGPFIPPCDTDACYFTYAAGAQVVSIDTCGSNFDTVIAYWGSATDATDLGSLNDDCQAELPPGAGSEPSASCYDNVQYPDGRLESCTCHDNRLPGDNVFAAEIIRWPDYAPPDWGHLFVHVAEAGSCGVQEEILASGTAFTYQGALENASGPVDDTCDFRFSLWDALEDGNEVGNSPQTRPDILVDRGAFGVKFDFGFRALDGTARWLEIEVQCPEDADFVLLSPRVELTPVPHAVRAMEGVGPPDALEVDTITGMVGIGTTEPTAKLHVNGQPGVDGIRFPDGTLQTTAAPVEIGDITRVIAGTGLSGGGDTGNVTLSIGNGAVTSSHILNGTIAADDLATNSVGSDEIATGAVGFSEIGFDSINSNHLVSDSFSLVKVSSGRLSIVSNQVRVSNNSPNSSLGVLGSAAIGSSFVSSSVPTNGLAVQGNAGIGINLPANRLDVAGNMSIGGSYAGVSAAPAHGLIVQGIVGIGTSSPTATLDVAGTVRVDTDALFVQSVSKRVGIGTDNPQAPLHVFGASPSGPGTGQMRIATTDTTGAAGSGAGIVFEGHNGAGLFSAGRIVSVKENAINTDSYLSIETNAGNMRISSFGRVGINNTNPSARLHVNEKAGTSPAVAGFNLTTGDGVVVEIQQDGITEGTISVAGTTVSYNAFTGSHYAWTNETIQRGTLVAMTGNNRRKHDDSTAEPIYGIQPSQRANDPGCLGAYLGLQDPSKPQTLDNPHQVMAVGNGDMWVVDTGRDLRPGEYLISSDTSGHAMVDAPSHFPVGYVIARVGEPVNWATVSDFEPATGRKHKRISVFFESFQRGDAAGLGKVVAQLQSETEELRRQVEAIGAIGNRSLLSVLGVVGICLCGVAIRRGSRRPAGGVL